MEEKRFQLVDTFWRQEGKCIRCGDRIGVGARWYKDITTGQEVEWSGRTACLCTGWQEEPVDPYKKK